MKTIQEPQRTEEDVVKEWLKCSERERGSNYVEMYDDDVDISGPIGLDGHFDFKKLINSLISYTAQREQAVREDESLRLIQILDLVKEKLGCYHCGGHKKLLDFTETTQKSLDLTTNDTDKV